MRISRILTAFACLSLALSALPNSRYRRRPPVAPNIVAQDQVGTAFLLPAVGSTPGAFGTYFRSEVVISNYRTTRQRIRITFLEQGVTNSGQQPIIRELPSYGENGQLALVTEDFVQSLGKSGLGAALVEAVDGEGNLDSNALIDGFSRIWTSQPPSDGCASPQGTTSQTMFAVPPTSLVGDEFSGFAVGLRHDENFRTNVGVVNLSSEEHAWTVEIEGTRGGTEVVVRVPAMSMQQVAVPAGFYGNLAAVFTLDDAHSNHSNVRWAAYASSTDNRTGDGWVRQASY
jgi:hypothetical protein